MPSYDIQRLGGINRFIIESVRGQAANGVMISEESRAAGWVMLV